jgi:hypothetical protein
MEIAPYLSSLLALKLVRKWGACPIDCVPIGPQRLYMRGEHSFQIPSKDMTILLLSIMYWQLPNYPFPIIHNPNLIRNPFSIKCVFKELTSVLPATIM